MTREQYEQGRKIYSDLSTCDNILKNIAHIEDLHISELIIKGILPGGRIPATRNYTSSLAICGIITSDEFSNFIIDKVKKRKTELESELAKI